MRSEIKVQNLVGKISILLQKAPNLGRLKKTDKKLKIFMIIAEIPKAYYCSVFCFLQTTDVYLINVWGYTKILPNLDSGICEIFACRIRNPRVWNPESKFH